MAAGVECGLNRIERLMRLQALRAHPRRRRLQKDEGDRPVENVPLNLLDRQFEAERPNLQRDNQDGNPATIRMRMRRCWSDEGRA